MITSPSRRATFQTPTSPSVQPTNRESNRKEIDAKTIDDSPKFVTGRHYTFALDTEEGEIINGQYQAGGNEDILIQHRITCLQQAARVQDMMQSYTVSPKIR